MSDLSQDKNIYNKLGLDETSYMPLSIRRILKTYPDAMGMEDYFFMRLFPLQERVAIYNNFLANQWATGFVPMVHYQNLNSKTLPTICDKLKSKIVGNIKIEGEDETNLDYITQRIVNFRNTIGTLETFVLNRGEACVVVDEVIDDEVESLEEQVKALLQVYPLTRYQLKKDALGRVYEALFYKELFNGQSQFTNYILCEHRFYKVRDGKKVPFTEFIIIQNQWRDNLGFWNDNVKTIRLDEKDIPKNILAMIPDDIKINKPKELKKLGVYRFKNTEANKLAPYCDIGESQFINATGFMMALETSMTYQEIDKYIGRGRALVPQLGDSSGLRRGQKSTNTLDYTFMTPYQAHAGSLDAKTPVEPVQFALRVDEWKMSFETAEAKVCARCGISVLDYDPTLSASVQRTATEVNYLNDITANTVKDKRALIKDELDRMVADICQMLEIDVKAFVVFDASTIVDSTQNAANTISQYQQGLISLETAIKQLHPNWKKIEVDAEINRITQEQDSRASEGAFNSTFGV